MAKGDVPEPSADALGDAVVRAARPTGPRSESCTETSTTSTACCLTTSGTSPPICSPPAGAVRSKRRSACSIQAPGIFTPIPPMGATDRWSAACFTAYGICRFRSRWSGPTRATAQRGGSLTDVAQPRALLRTPGPPGHLGQDDHRTAGGRRACPPRANLISRGGGHEIVSPAGVPQREEGGGGFSRASRCNVFCPEEAPLAEQVAPVRGRAGWWRRLTGCRDVQPDALPAARGRRRNPPRRVPLRAPADGRLLALVARRRSSTTSGRRRT